MAKYPMVGFHFAVYFQLSLVAQAAALAAQAAGQALGDSAPIAPPGYDLMFQEVSGLTVSVETEEFTEGGENRFKHRLPTRTNYNDLEFKRGVLLGSALIYWFKNAIENFEFEPVNLTIMLFNDLHIPVSAWYVVNAYPKQWSVSSFNAHQSELVVDTLTITYDYFKSLRI